MADKPDKILINPFLWGKRLVKKDRQYFLKVPIFKLLFRQIDAGTIRHNGKVPKSR